MKLTHKNDCKRKSDDRSKKPSFTTTMITNRQKSIHRNNIDTKNEVFHS